MSNEHNPAQRILKEALARPAADREAFIARRCGNDAVLLAEVRALLAEPASSAVFENVAPETAAKDGGQSADAHRTVVRSEPPNSPPIPKSIGKYRLKRRIGSGGMGTVYLAVQEQPRRTVALKVMNSGVTSRSALRRFEYEAQILARLRHSNIAQVYDAGTHDDGQGGVPYFAMEYVPNARTLTEFARVKKLGTKQRLDLFAKVCDAVHHGHQKGIIHRDLKPGNILVDSAGEPKIIDFGVARATDSDMAVTTLQTDVGQLIGTLQYMSPEQCDADPHDIDTRSDVYALGVVLYELLCEKLPYDLSRVAIHEAARVIQEESPTRPSTINRHLRGDIETITLKAIEKERERRYRSASDLADDLRRYLNDEPIEARRPGAIYQIRMFARRNKSVFAAISGIAAVLVVATVVSVTLAIRASVSEKKALAEAERRREAEEHAVAAAEDADTARRTAERRAYVASIYAAQASLERDDVTGAQRHLDAASPELRNWEWHYLANRVDLSTSTLRGHIGGVVSVAFSPDGSRLASGSDDASIGIWDVSTGKEIATCRNHEVRVVSVVFSPSGHQIASGSWDNTVRTWDATTGRQIGLFEGHDDFVSSVAFSPDGSLLASGSWDGTIKLWYASSSENLATFQAEGPVGCVVFVPDGSHVASGSADGAIQLWSVSGGAPVHEFLGHEASVRCLASSSDGRRLASGSDDGTVRLWEGLTETTVLRAHRAEVTSVSFSPDGSLVASGSSDRTVRIWDANKATELASLRGHAASVGSVSFSPDGLLVASGSNDTTIKLWSAIDTDLVPTFEGRLLAVSADGTRLVTDADALPDPGSKATLWDTISAREIAGLQGCDSVTFSPDGSLCAALCTETSVQRGRRTRAVKTWSAVDGREVATLCQTEGPISSSHPVFSPNGSLIAVGLSDGSVKLFDTRTNVEARRLAGHEGPVRDVAFSADGSRLVSKARRDDKSELKLWDPSNGDMVATFTMDYYYSDSVYFCRDASRLVTYDGQTISLRNAMNGKEIATVEGSRGLKLLQAGPPSPNAMVARSAFGTKTPKRRWPDWRGRSFVFPNESQIITGGDDGTIRVWDLVRFNETNTLAGHSGAIDSLSCSPDGSRLVSVSTDRSIRIWDLESGEELIELHGHTGAVQAVEFCRDGSRIISSSFDLMGGGAQEIKVWDGSVRDRDRSDRE